MDRDFRAAWVDRASRLYRRLSARLAEGSFRRPGRTGSQRYACQHDHRSSDIDTYFTFSTRAPCRRDLSVMVRVAGTKKESPAHHWYVRLISSSRHRPRSLQHMGDTPLPRSMTRRSGFTRRARWATAAQHLRFACDPSCRDIFWSSRDERHGAPRIGADRLLWLVSVEPSRSFEQLDPSALDPVRPTGPMDTGAADNVATAESGPRYLWAPITRPT